MPSAIEKGDFSGSDLDKRGALDRFREKIVSRKLLVWLTGTIGMFIGVVSDDNWVAISLAYIAIQGIADIASQWRGNPPRNPSSPPNQASSSILDKIGDFLGGDDDEKEESSKSGVEEGEPDADNEELFEGGS